MHADRTASPGLVGLGLKTQHLPQVLGDGAAVDFFEVHAENYMVDGGPYLRHLQRVRERWPLSVHGVGLSIGGESPLDRAHLARLKHLCGWLDPASFSVSVGLLYIVAAAFVGSAGGIVMKRIDKINALQMQAWVGLFSFAPLLAFSAVTETGQVSAFVAGGWPVWAASLFAIVGVSIFGHGAFYTLIKKYDISLLSPLTLMTPIWGVIFGIVLLNEPITARP